MAENTKKWKLKADSLSKLVIYFNDGNRRTFYSRDWRHSSSPDRDSLLGLNRLITLAGRYRHSTKAAAIYNLHTNEMIARHTDKEGMVFINP